MKTIQVRKWDIVEHLETDEDRAMYPEACIEEAGDDAAFIAGALGDIARAKGMTRLAREIGMAREGLNEALSVEGNPSFGTILDVMRALKLKLHVQIAHA
uniref:Probable addiction module antidote protein n=1 Tax=Candidatus Kentrum sp. SD TaxID=2126332 RepID=A0A451BJ15_9GAMM|nr:MAG: probable addiction module antidote protein [Candidatus Kentron sp. SD]VFK41171.1 MAG: probable addiction module antidote protein [Candidatus Kentron sp. SD]VFK78282.1 MAG: probable addiction module antidote protein [Candidatus Kentron sp. SD]